MRSRCVRIPIKATAHVPIDRPDTYQRLPTARPHLRTAAGPYIRVDLRRLIVVRRPTGIGASRPIGALPGEGLLSQPTTVARPWARERVFVPHTCRSRHPPGPAQLGGQRSFADTRANGKVRRFRTLAEVACP